jgi:hypothetical protein
MKISIVIIFLILSKITILPILAFRGELPQGEKMPFSFRFKNLKCNVTAKEKVKQNFCYIKAHSRTLTSLNIGFEFLEDVVYQLDVTCKILFLFFI